MTQTVNPDLVLLVDKILDKDAGYLNVVDLDSETFKLVEYVGADEISLGVFPIALKEFAAVLVNKICGY